MNCPTYLTAYLMYLDSELTRIMENRSQEEYDSPFYNSGNVAGYKNDTFEVHAYDWCWDVEDSRPRPVNFKCGDIEVTWYKHYRRGCWVNREITENEALVMFNKCVASLQREEDKDDN